MRNTMIHAPNRPAPTENNWWAAALLLPATLLLLMIWFISSTHPIPLAAINTGNRPQPQTAGLAGEPSCIDPAADEEPICEAAARRILASTVRVMFLGDGPVRIGHGTVVGGRYVITHNHYTTYDPEMDDAEPAGTTRISLALANGEFILRNAPLSNFTVVAAEPGMLLLDFRTVAGEGFFDHLGIPSAPVAAWNSASIQSGSEVAQVNWDGKATFVEWVRVSAIRDSSSMASLEIENYIELGASGGGIFLDGYHIANNCLQGSIYQRSTRELVRGYSVAVPNSETILSTIGTESSME